MRKIWIALCFLATVALAADEPRKINFETALADFDGKAITECADDPGTADRDCKTKRSITLGLIATRALIVPEQGLSAEESFKRGELARRVYHSDGIALTVEEIALIKKQIAKNFSPLIVVQTFGMLDPSSK